MGESKRIQAGVLSYGMSGKAFHAPFLNTHLGFAFVGVVERMKKSAQSKYPSVRSYDSVDDLLDDEQIELVVVNTPNFTHFEFAKKALLAGKHVVVEKPFVPTVQEATELFDLGRAQGRSVMVFQNRRWDSDFRSLKQVLDDQICGRPIELHLRFDRYRPEIGPKLFKETPYPGSGVLFDLGSHLLDQAISLFGRPAKVMKTKSTHRNQGQVDDVSSVVLSYQHGLTIYIHVSLLIKNPLPAFVLYGSKGTFTKHRTDRQEAQLLAGIWPDQEEYGWERPTDDGSLLLIDGDEIQEKKIGAPQGDYNAFFDAVFDQIRHHKPFPITESQILCQLEILE